jgi:hypothetical protein
VGYTQKMFNLDKFSPVCLLKMQNSSKISVGFGEAVPTLECFSKAFEHFLKSVQTLLQM